MRTQITLDGRLNGGGPLGEVRSRVQLAAAIVAAVRGWQDEDVQLEIEQRQEGWSLSANCSKGAQVLDVEVQGSGTDGGEKRR
jgi:hypothetical protein